MVAKNLSQKGYKIFQIKLIQNNSCKFMCFFKQSFNKISGIFISLYYCKTLPLFLYQTYDLNMLNAELHNMTMCYGKRYKKHEVGGLTILSGGSVVISVDANNT